MCHVIDDVKANDPDTFELQQKTEIALRKLVPESSYDWCNPESIVDYGEVEKHILQIAREVRADLIVLGATPSASWLIPMSEGIVGNVIAGAECPVMTICTD